MRALLALTVGAGMLLALAAADEAVAPDGDRHAGELRWQDGRLLFRAKDRTAPLTDFRRVRLPSKEGPPLCAGVVHQFLLCGGQQVTGELLGLDADAVKLRTAWSDRPLTVPRARVRAITQPPGFLTYFDDDFEDGLKDWKLTGKPGPSDREHTSGKQSLLLDAAGQVAEYVLPEEMKAGRAGINFLDSAARDAGRWAVEADLGDGRPVRVTVAGDAPNYTASVPGADEPENKVPRAAGWHRLALEFDAKSLSVLVDQHVLWTGRGRGPLRKVRLTCDALPSRAAVAGKVWFDDFSLARPLEALPRPAGEVGRDELWLRDGDQLFGVALRADRRAVEFQGRFGKRSVPWGEVRGLYLKRATPPPRATEGEHVRLQLDAGTGAAADEIEGVVRKLDDRRLTLQHVGGETDISRERLRQVQGTLHGRRVELDNDLHHLGRDTIAAFPLPRPDGLNMHAKFTLAAVPAEAFLVVEVSHLQGPGDGREVAAVLERGGLRTEVRVNDTEVDYLNRHGGRASPEPRSLRLRVPKQALRAGENVLEVRLTPDGDTGQYADGMIHAIALEIPR